MTKGRRNSVGVVLLSFCLCPAVNAQASSLDELIEDQESALETLERVVAGPNPYLQFRTAQEAVRTVRQRSEKVAQESRKIEQERVELAGQNQQLAFEKDALIKEQQGLSTYNQNLVKANENLTSGNNQLMFENERLKNMQRLFSMAFYTALALGFLGFGGLLVRTPNSRLERRLKRLEIADLENKLKKETARSQREETRPRQAERPVAELRAVEVKPSQAGRRSAEAKTVNAGSSDVQEAIKRKEQVTALGDKAKEGKAELMTEVAKSGKGEDRTKKCEIKQKQKKKR